MASLDNRVGLRFTTQLDADGMFFGPYPVESTEADRGDEVLFLHRPRRNRVQRRIDSFNASTLRERLKAQLGHREILGVIGSEVQPIGNRDGGDR
jgi:hypothetical protein